MMPRDVLNYSFTSSAPLDFNIHCHEGGNVICPVKTTSAGETGKYYAEKEQIYCLMWTNTQTTPVQLKYTFSLEKKNTTPLY